MAANRGNIGADELNKAGFNAVTIERGYAAGKRLKRGAETVILAKSSFWQS